MYDRWIALNGKKEITSKALKQLIVEKYGSDLQPFSLFRNEEFLGDTAFIKCDEELTVMPIQCDGKITIKFEIENDFN